MKMVKALETGIPITLKQALEWELTPDTREKAIKASYLRGTESYLMVGLLLREAKDRQDWKDAGVANSFWEWVEKELGISTSHGKRMLDVWDHIRPFITEHYDLVLQIDFSRLVEIVPVLRQDPQKALEWLHMAATNSVRDLKNNIIEHKGGTPTDKCEHPLSHNEIWNKCTVCGKFYK